MQPTKTPALTPRDRDILKDVILTYILTAEPVSSRSVSKHGQLGLSAATIRNVMADLEEWGFLAQPHTSAGRVPTRAAYHLFIQTMMETRAISARERRYIEENIKGVPADADQLMEVTSHLLSELTNQVGVVVTPTWGDTVLKAVDFVPLSGRKVLCVVVSTTGFVENKVIETDEPVPREELVRTSNYLTENFAGQTLREIRDRLLRRMTEERAQMDRWLNNTLELARRGLDLSQGPGVVLDGTSGLLNQPELADLGRVRRMFETFADKARLVNLLNQCVRGGGVRVLIGEDSDLTSELDFSLVATPYGVGDRTLGTLGIFGPSRMEYQKIIPLVDFLGETLSRALAESFSGPETK
ncbi:MAG TPA: heat-inducible transcriptional repressor HrcA [Thermoanaerobaculia bacterium]|jgi:heat-inducible transcriptional repressor|nr:heat-inducible transcriptional repressor HrcA [Thermoanaerobaculia bacterium]